MVNGRSNGPAPSRPNITAAKASCSSPSALNESLACRQQRSSPLPRPSSHSKATSPLHPQRAEAAFRFASRTFREVPRSDVSQRSAKPSLIRQLRPCAPCRETAGIRDGKPTPNPLPEEEIAMPVFSLKSHFDVGLPRYVNAQSKAVDRQGHTRCKSITHDRSCQSNRHLSLSSTLHLRRACEIRRSRSTQPQIQPRISTQTTASRSPSTRLTHISKNYPAWERGYPPVAVTWGGGLVQHSAGKGCLNPQ